MENNTTNAAPTINVTTKPSTGKKIKNWFKKHKGEIIVGTLAIGGTLLGVKIYNDIRQSGFNAGVEASMRLDNLIGEAKDASETPDVINDIFNNFVDQMNEGNNISEFITDAEDTFRMSDLGNIGTAIIEDFKENDVTGDTIAKGIYVIH